MLVFPQSTTVDLSCAVDVAGSSGTTGFAVVAPSHFPTSFDRGLEWFDTFLELVFLELALLAEGQHNGSGTGSGLGDRVEKVFG